MLEMGPVPPSFKPALWRALVLIPLLATASAGVVADSLAGSWTAIIEAFPRQAYSWHFMPDGTYQEDGRDVATGKSVQPRLYGHWRKEGGGFVLLQDGIDYRFEGVMSDGLYSGMLYLDGHPFSRFCAMEGDRTPASCNFV